MKKQYLICLIFLFSVLTMTAQKTNNKYISEWERVDKFMEESLPQSAISAIDSILLKAIAEKNNTQVVKALIVKNKNNISIDKDNNLKLIADFEALATQANDVNEQSLLYSMLAELYYNYYENNRWNIRGRTALSDLVPDDIKEWTENIFIDKIIENLDLSVKEKNNLKGHTTKEYDDIILLGSDGERYYPTLYDFLMMRTIELAKKLPQGFDSSATGQTIEKLILPANEYVKLTIEPGADKKYSELTYYQQYLKDLLSRNLLPTIIVTDIDRISYLKNRYWGSEKEKVDQAYEELYKVYQNNETSIEIIKHIVINYPYNDQAKRNKAIYDWVKKGIGQYPDYYAIYLLKDELKQIEQPNIEINASSLYHPQNEIKIDLYYKNPQKFETKPDFKLYKVEDGKYTKIKDFPLDLVSKTTYNADTLSLNLGKLPVGRYCFSPFNPEVKTENSQNFNFVVSSLTSFSRNRAKNEYEIFVVDRITGQPQKDVTIKIFQDSRSKEFTGRNVDDINPLSILRTNEMGLAIYKQDTSVIKSNDLSYKIELAQDSCLDKQQLYSQSYRWEYSNGGQEVTNVTSILIDRSIYRPGQTVYFKAITLNKDSKPVTKKKMTVGLYNTNGELVTEKELVSNEFGSVFGEFILPKAGLLGQYSIQVENNSNYFSVEEYKRPTFEVTFDKSEKTYTFGDEVTIKGHAKNFSGVSLQDAEVKYTITREQFSFWRSGNGSQFAEGSVKTDADGSFEITFTPQPGDDRRSLLRIGNDKNIYLFNISAKVTDLNGETQNGNYGLSVGNVSMVMNIDLPDKIEKASDYKFEITARNLESQEIKASGKYMMFSLDENDSIKVKITEGSFEAGDQTTLKNKLKNTVSGKYRIRISALDDKQREITEQKDFILFSYSDKKPPIKTKEWFITKNTVFGKDKPVEVIYGSSDKETYLLYQLVNNDKVFDARFIKLSNSNHIFTIPYKQEYGDEVNLSLVTMKDGQLYSQNVSLKKEETIPDTKLTMKLEVFRDRLRPGQEETWTISVKDTTNIPVAAELLASMYDTSLDKLSSYSPWNITRPYIYKER
ncbi:MAG: hypothetical protein LBV43_01645, partial [Prevotella sp.]|nr:hypothetical protein [Prevotella sp.]